MDFEKMTKLVLFFKFFWYLLKKIIFFLTNAKKYKT